MEHTSYDIKILICSSNFLFHRFFCITLSTFGETKNHKAHVEISYVHLFMDRMSYKEGLYAFIKILPYATR